MSAPAPISLPKDLQGFRGYHARETILVCGCGPSLNQVVAPERCISIGVNDIGRLFQPDYLVVLNSRRDFHPERFRYVEESRARAVFTQVDLGIPHPNVVKVRLGARAGVDFDDPTVLHYARNSPYLAVCLAVHMGAARIGLIGVDFTDDHFFGPTGRHPLASELPTIDGEYARLGAACRKLGVEIVNLGEPSRLTAFPKITPEEFSRLAIRPSGPAERRKLFVVNFEFKSCGASFGTGLSRAAEELGVPHELAAEDDPRLCEKVKRFKPDLLLVVHGRNFVRRWGKSIRGIPTAVWLLDEPYEVDDTSGFSGWFDTVFLNDAATLDRHRNAHYLPVCYDPWEHWYRPAEERGWRAGFVGGASPEREKILSLLAERKLLDFVVGGPWRSPVLRRLSRADLTSPAETADLYRRTRLVLNIFRAKHNFNSRRAESQSLNPRVYEAAACGAVPVTGPRRELKELCPDAPVFAAAEEAAARISELLENPEKYLDMRRRVIRALREHTFSHRLIRILEMTKGARHAAPARKAIKRMEPDLAGSGKERPSAAALRGWEIIGEVEVRHEERTSVLSKAPDIRPGGEAGLETRARFGDVALSFEVFLDPGTVFIAKIHHADHDPMSNSYHVYRDESRAYLARHDQILCPVTLPAGRWVPLEMAYRAGTVTVLVDGQPSTARDSVLAEGHCFIGLQGGRVKLRNIKAKPAGFGSSDYTVAYEGENRDQPAVSIITTVYDRVACLERCLASVNALEFRDYEQVVVADCPEASVQDRLREAVARADAPLGKRLFAILRKRANDWGITPAALGLSLARGRYICFLSDDNGYAADHLGPLVESLDQDPQLGFAYSSCCYDGRAVLASMPPRLGSIDLGQPLFRRQLFDEHLGGSLPFREAAWDWRLIRHFLERSVRWKYLNRPTFYFRLEKYLRASFQAR